jgi:hypothetical protein
VYSVVGASVVSKNRENKRVWVAIRCGATHRSCASILILLLIYSQLRKKKKKKNIKHTTTMLDVGENRISRK